MLYILHGYLSLLFSGLLSRLCWPWLPELPELPDNVKELLDKIFPSEFIYAIYWLLLLAILIINY